MHILLVLFGLVFRCFILSDILPWFDALSYRKTLIFGSISEVYKLARHNLMLKVKKNPIFSDGEHIFFPIGESYVAIVNITGQYSLHWEKIHACLIVDFSLLKSEKEKRKWNLA